MIRGIVYWFCGSLLTFFFFIFLIIVTPFLRNRRDFYRNVIRIWAKILLRVFCSVKTETRGMENLLENAPCVIVSNHRSFMDIIVGLAVVPVQFRWFAKRSLFRIPVIGTAMRMAGYVSVERGKSRSASKSLLEAERALAQGDSLWVFPEGTRTRGKELGPFKRGAFHIAMDTGRPLVPVSLAHTDKIFVKPFVIKPRLIRVVVDRPLYHGMEGDGRKTARESMHAITDSVRRVIQRNYDASISPAR